MPAWLQAWWQHFNSGAELYIRAARDGEEIIGIAPLQVQEGNAAIIGSVDVCDYLDFIVAPGRESEFFNVLLDDLKSNGIGHLDLKPLRPDSAVLAHLMGIARDRQYDVSCREEEVSVELGLPATWEEYLAMLSKKQRHEVRRKLRRLWEAADVDFRCIEVNENSGQFMDDFLKLFSLSREDKANFMTARMESFFRALAEAMAAIGLLRFGVVEVKKQPVAMTIGFDYNNSHYLYNSAYDPQYNYLSVGLLCKILCLRESIAKGREKWDFLKGGEPYKYQIGGREIPQSSCEIIIR